MGKLPENQNNFDAMSDYEVDEIEYEEMELLERLETLREEMEDLGVTTLAEVNQRIEELHRRLDIQNE
jgi:ribosomal protein S18